ncbi:hypothetical protein V2J09_023367 [Rumex salicifolius]
MVLLYHNRFNGKTINRLSRLNFNPLLRFPNFYHSGFINLAPKRPNQILTRFSLPPSLSSALSILIQGATVQRSQKLLCDFSKGQRI